MSGRRQLQGPVIGLAIVLSTFALPALAQQQVVHNERDIGDLRVGQRIWVDDGSCPAGQIKQITGSQLTQSGVVRTRTCVQRFKK